MPTDATSERPPLRADAERNRRKLLDSARELFAAKGLSVGLDEIARHACVGVGTAYRRFPDKEALIAELFEDRVAAVAAIADEALAIEDAWEGFVHFFRGSAGLFASDRALKEVMLARDEGNARVAKMREQIKPRVAKLVARAREAGTLRADAAALDVPLLNIMLGLLADAARDTRPDVWERALGIVLDGLVSRRDAPTPLAVPPLEQDELEATIQAAARR
jgi:AcrR family transcriptional regulator